MKDLPKINGKVVCFLGLLGMCQYHTAGGCHFYHVSNLTELTPQFLREWEEIITVGVEKIIADNKLPEAKKTKKRRVLDQK